MSDADETQRDAAASVDAAAVVAHLVAMLPGGECTPRAIFAHLKGTLRWREPGAHALIEQAVVGRLLALHPVVADRLVPGPAFDPAAFPREKAIAQRAAARLNRVPRVDRTQGRRDMIFAALSRTVPQPTDALWKALAPEFGYRRKLERDLADLLKAGLVTRDPEGWRDARELDLVVEHATATALGLLLNLYEDLVPFELQYALRKHVGKAKKGLETLPLNEPAVRWLRALRIVPPRHEFDTPRVDPSIRDAFEAAILGHRQLRLRWLETDHNGNEYERSADCSVSHLLIEIPANPQIDVWIAGRGERLAMNDIVAAELLDQRADFPADYEPAPVLSLMTMSFGDASAHEGRSLVTLQMRRGVFATLRRRRIGKLLEVLQDGPGEWLTVTFRAALDMPLLAWLNSLEGVVILGPRLFRVDATSRARNAWTAYKDSADEAVACAREEEHWYETEHDKP